MLGKDQVWKVSDKVSKPLSPYPTASRSGMSEAPKSIFANISYSEASQPVCSGVLEEAGVDWCCCGPKGDTGRGQ